VAARARAAIASRLVEAPAYLTTTAEAQRFEDELERLGKGASGTRPSSMVEHVRSLDSKLARLTVPYEEWETLYRMRLQLERDALAATTGDDTTPPLGVASTSAETGPRPRSTSRFGLAAGFVGMALVAVDIVLVLSQRRSRAGR
jgi:hypothetical protein